MSNLNERETWRDELSNRERVIWRIVCSWIVFAKLVASIFIIGGTIYGGYSGIYGDSVIWGAIAGFIAFSFLVQLVQLILIGLPAGFVGGLYGAVIGTLLTVCRFYLVLPKWPSDLLWGAAFGAVGGMIFVGGLETSVLAPEVGFWPLSVYMRAFRKLIAFVAQRMAPRALGLQRTSEGTEDIYGRTPEVQEEAPNPGHQADG